MGLYNPILFDFALKGLLRFEGQSFANSVFETRSFFLNCLIAIHLILIRQDKIIMPRKERIHWLAEYRYLL